MGKKGEPLRTSFKRVWSVRTSREKTGGRSISNHDPEPVRISDWRGGSFVWLKIQRWSFLLRSGDQSCSGKGQAVAASKEVRVAVEADGGGPRWCRKTKR